MPVRTYDVEYAAVYGFSSNEISLWVEVPNMTRPKLKIKELMKCVQKLKTNMVKMIPGLDTVLESFSQTFSLFL